MRPAPPNKLTRTQGDVAVTRGRSLAEQVADAVVSMIHDRGLRAGDALPSGAELAERFAVSRSVVREAIADLAARGMVERSQGRESVVSSPGPDQLGSLLDFHVQQRQLDGGQLLEVRMTLEVQTSRLAAERASREQVTAVRDAWTRLAAAKSESRFQDADIEFHRAVAEASGNPLFVLILDALTDSLRDQRMRSIRGANRVGHTMAAVAQDHLRILEAIETSNPAEAAAAMQRHLQTTAADLAAGSAE